MKNKKYLIIVGIIVFVLVAGVGMSLLIENREKTSKQYIQVENNNKNENLIENKEYSVFTDIDAITSNEWNRDSSEWKVDGYHTNKEVFEILYEREIGLLSGSIPIPRTNFYTYSTKNGENYKVEINVNKWFFAKNIKALSIREDSSLDFYVLDNNFKLNPLRLEVTYRETNGFKNSEDLMTIYEYNGWTFIGRKEDSMLYFIGGYYKLDDLYINYENLNGLNTMSKEKFEEFCRSLSENIKIEKNELSNLKEIELPEDYSKVKLSDKFYLNLGDIELVSWNSDSSGNYINGNGIIFVDKNLGSSFHEIVEYVEGTTWDDINNKYNETILKYSEYTFKDYNYKDIEFKLVYSRSKFEGIIFENNGNFYQINDITLNKDIENTLDYIFDNIIIEDV